MRGWLEDLRDAWRSARKRPGRSLVVCCGLALGLGANVAVFSYLDFLLWAQLPAREPERLVWVEDPNPANGTLSGAVSYPDYLDYRDRNRVLTDLAGFSTFSTTVDTGGATLHAWGQLVSGNLFSLLGVDPQRGRALGPEDDRPGAEPVAVVSASFWRRALNGEPGVLGRTLRLNDHPVRVVGVLPEGFLGAGFPVEVYLPIAHQELIRAKVRDLGDRHAAWVGLFGRLRPGVGLGTAQAALRAVAAGLDRLDPRPGAPRKLVVSAAGRIVDPVTRKGLYPAVLRIQIFVGLLLLLACANVASLLLANTVDRQSDLAVRVALGASRGRLARQLLAESLFLALLGGVAGLGLGSPAMRLIERALNAASASSGLGTWGDGWVHLRLDFRVLGFSLLLCLATGVLSGLVPALLATSPSRRHRLLSAQRGGGTAAEPGSRLPAQTLLVVLQVAMSTWLLAATGFLAQSVWRLEHLPTGFDAPNLLLATCVLPEGPDGSTSPRQGRIFEAIADDLRTLPGVGAVSLTWNLPLAGWSRMQRLELPERPGETRNEAVSVVGRDYFATLGIPRLAGRGFEPRDAAGALPVAIVSRAMAERFWPRQSALGRRLVLLGEAGRTAVQVIGVVADTKTGKLWEPAAPLLYLPVAQSPHRLMTLLVRPSAPESAPAGLPAALRRELRRTHPEMAILDVLPFATQLERNLWHQRMNSRFLGLFGALGLTLAALGVGSAMSFTVSRRRREIGIRMALGSTPGGVQSLILGRALAQVAAGVLLGLLSTLAFVRLLGGLVEGTETRADPWTLAAATLVLFVVGLLATWEPAHRAAQTDPSVAFRAE